MAKKENEGLTDEQIRQLLELEAQSKEIAERRALPWQERWATLLGYIRENYDKVWKDLSIERMEQIKRNLEQWRDQIKTDYYGDDNEDNFLAYLKDKIQTIKNRIDFLKSQPKPKKEKKKLSVNDFFAEKTSEKHREEITSRIKYLAKNRKDKELAEYIYQCANYFHFVKGGTVSLSKLINILIPESKKIKSITNRILTYYNDAEMLE